MSSDSEIENESNLVADNYIRFKTNLENNYDLKYEEEHINAEGVLIKPVREWRYCGGDAKHKFNDTFSIDDKGELHMTPRYKYFLLYFKGNPPAISWESHCVCGVAIFKNYYITDDKGNLLVIGSECKKAFITKSGKTCEDCGATHKCRKQNKCIPCAKKNNKKIKEKLKEEKKKLKQEEARLKHKEAMKPIMERYNLKHGLECTKCEKAKEKKYLRCYECNKKYNEHKSSITKKAECCEHCNGTGEMYWMDDIYGECIHCQDIR